MNNPNYERWERAIEETFDLLETPHEDDDYDDGDKLCWVNEIIDYVEHGNEMPNQYVLVVELSHGVVLLVTKNNGMVRWNYLPHHHIYNFDCRVFTLKNRENE